MPDSVSPYLHARATKAPTLSPDGHLAFLSNTTGTMQVWTLEEPGRWPTQRTFYDERVSFVEWSPTGDSLVFGKDAGADEHDQLFGLDPATGRIDQLTDRPDAIHTWGGFHPGGDQIAFTANRRETAHFDAYVMDLKDGEPRLISEGEGRIFVSGWSPDGTALLAGEAHASSDYDLYAIDVATGERTHLTPHEGHTKYLFPTFGPDGSSVYCLSDAASDRLELVRIDLESKSLEPVSMTVPDGTGHEEWSIDGFALDTDTGQLCFTRNVDGYSALFAGSFIGPTAADVRAIDTPTGVIGDLTIDTDGKHAAMTISATNLNYSSYVLDLETLEEPTPTLERWTEPSPGGVPLEAYHVPEIIRYETFDGREIPAFLSFPDTVDPADAETPVPVIVDIHGGPHAQRRPSWRNRPIRQYFLDQGYALFEPNVRGSSGYGAEYAALDDVEKRMDSVRDVAAGVDWLADHPAIEETSVVCYGRSYGGFMVLACITEYPDLWAAAVDFVGIANWVTFLENTGAYRRPHREAEYGSLTDDREFLESISPIHQVDAIQCPLFVQHGANDPRVPVEEARQIADAVSEQGIPVETCIFEDEGHHTTKLENRIEQFDRIAAFLEEHVPPA